MNLVNKKAFTLIELIVVLIITGVLASLAMTSLFTWIERSRFLPVALLNLKQLKDSVDVCNAKNGDIARCINEANSIVRQMQTNLPAGYILDAKYGDEGQSYWYALINTSQSLAAGWVPGGLWQIDCGNIQSTEMSYEIYPSTFYDSAGVGFCRKDDGSIETKSWGIYVGTI